MQVLLRPAWAIAAKARRRLRAWQLQLAAAKRVQANRLDQPLETPRAVRMDCRLCGTKSAAHEILGCVPLTQQGEFDNDVYELVHCAACDVVYLLPLPSTRDLNRLYLETEQFDSASYSGSAESSRILRSYARRLDYLDLLPAAGEAVLEVGAGLAWVSRACKQRRPDVRTIAQDVSDECVSRCAWVDDYRIGPIEAWPLQSEFRLISMTHVIEHLPNPQAILANLAQRLIGGGKIYITAPFRPPLWKHRHGIGPWLTYGYLHVPAHLSYFSRCWFERKAPACGLELVHWDDSHDGHQVCEVVLSRLRG
ncbi:MAG: class I SAM-dependent methyltransferase [Rudaea sp.]